MPNEKIQYHNFQEVEKGFDGQNPTITVEIETKLQSFPGINKKFLTVSLQGTQVAASPTGKMKFDSDTERGWYTESVEILMSLADKNPHSLTLRETSPETTSERTTVAGSESSGTSMGGGVFGGSVMGNLSFNSMSASSYAQAVPDFKLSNLSDLYHLHHVYSLSAIPQGGYTGPASLENIPSTSSAIGDFFSGKGLVHTTLKQVSNNDGNAICDLPIYSQALWMAPTGVYRETPVLVIGIIHKLVNVKLQETPLPMLQTQQRKFSVSNRIPINFAEVDDVSG